MCTKFYSANPECKWPFRESNRRHEEMEVKVTLSDCVHWIHLAQGRAQWLFLRKMNWHFGLYKSSFVRSPSLFYLLVHSRCRGCLFSLDHTPTHTTVGRTPLDEGSACRRDLYLTTQTLYKRQTSMPPGGIRTHDPSKRSAADLRLRSRGHWDRPF
jgi:hypothetical protein